MEAERTASGAAGEATGEAVEPLERGPLTFHASARAVALGSVFVCVAAGMAAMLAGVPIGYSLIGGLLLALLFYGVAWWIRVGSYGIRIDARGIQLVHPRGGPRIAWAELQTIDLAETAAQVRGRPVRLRYIVLEGRSGEKILFADLSSLGSPAIRIELNGPRQITDIADSGVLLAVIADRAGDDRYLPDVLLERARADSVPDAADAAPVPTQVPAEKRRVSVGGFLVLLAKLGTKLAKGIPVALKTFKPGLLLASGALYGVLFSWQFAVAIMVMLAFHEYGHVHAMRRAGLQVRGIYFIPLLGAAAVTEDTWRTRTEQARIALAGPIWGLGLTLAAAAVDAATGYAHPFLGVIVSWWALVNLFNLLPVNPLDGGRVLAAIGYSLHSSFGAALSAAMFVAALVLAWAFDITLLAIVGAVGLLEFAGEIAGAIKFRRLTSSPRVAALSPGGLATLKGLARPSLSEEADQAYFHFEMRQASRLRQLARVTPMTRGQAVRWGIAYAVVTAALLALMFFSAGAHPDAALAREILR